MELDVLVTEGLGDTSYLLTWGDEGAVVDPQRDVERFVDAARARGATIAFGTPVVLSVPDDEALAEASLQLRRIGWDAVPGFLCGIDAWAASGRATSSYPTMPVEQLVDELAADVTGEILDVRQATEWDDGHLDGSRHVFVGDLPEQLDGFDRSQRQTVICASGYRSSMAASLLAGAGVPVRLVARSGVPRALRSLASSRWPRAWSVVS